LYFFIEEQAVDFERDFIVEIKFNKFKKDKARLFGLFSDGDKTTDYTGLNDKLRNLELSEGDDVTLELFGKKIKISRLEKKKAKFEILNP